ncbi:hypothetical protein [Rossellomorea marisflavi]|uniref:hypothetical protein n=1 Tax=Rossellomorea marisflavi TaxID=189381 RepID=UPI00295ED009|nr:hypothetical protein [Rossellomorea marisflavi]
MMGFKLPEEYYIEKQRVHELKYIDLNGEKLHVSDLEDRSVTIEVRDQMLMNSYAKDDFPPKLTDEALIDEVEHYKTFCTRQKYNPCLTYDESMINVLVPEMVSRLKMLTQENKRYQEINKGLLDKVLEFQQKEE